MHPRTAGHPHLEKTRTLDPITMGTRTWRSLAPWTRSQTRPSQTHTQRPKPKKNALQVRQHLPPSRLLSPRRFPRSHRPSPKPRHPLAFAPQLCPGALLPAPVTAKKRRIGPRDEASHSAGQLRGQVPDQGRTTPFTSARSAHA